MVQSPLPPGRSRFRRPYNACETEIDERGARLTVLVMPIYKAEARWEVQERLARDLSLGILESLGIRAVDLQPDFLEAVALGLPVDTVGIGGLVAVAVARVLFGPPPLLCTAEPREVAAGETQTVRVSAGAEFAGRRFLVLGSIRGVVPASDLPRGRVMLAEDDYLQHTSDRSSPPFTGELDGEGNAVVALPVPSGAEPGRARAGARASIVWHLAVVADPRGIHYERVGWPMPMIVPGK